ncbi:hypothetical protein [Streptomyces xanthochromogenes]|uniref:hypothetical protein n=1 Tax=Streptomyces xanthochromogenes TaxID=67384 RepID=UPI003829E014
MHRVVSAGALGCVTAMCVAGLLAVPAAAAPSSSGNNLSPVSQCVADLQTAQVSSGQTIVAIQAGDFVSAQASNNTSGNSLGRAVADCPGASQSTPVFARATQQQRTLRRILRSAVPSAAGPLAALYNETLGVLKSFYEATIPHPNGEAVRG